MGRTDGATIMSMDVFFNELSVSGGCELGYGEIESLKKLYLELRGVPGMDFVCRVNSGLLAEMTRYIAAQSNGREVMGFLYAFLRPPFEGASSEDAQNTYLQSQWRCGGEECFGLAMASILDTLAISIDRAPWDVPNLRISRDTSNVVVRNCSRAEHVSAHGEWAENLFEPELVPCGVSPEDKAIKLRDDHGVDVLRAFAQRLLKSEYVIEVINSLEFHPKSRRFVRSFTTDGVVELVLNWTDAGYGLAVQTTGRNLRETEKIARCLESEFGHVA